MWGTGKIFIACTGSGLTLLFERTLETWHAFCVRVCAWLCTELQHMYHMRLAT